MKKNIYSATDLALRIWASTSLQKYDISKTIAIASSGRGGSTWLAEIVGILPGRPIIWEPLHPQKNPECKQYGFGYRVYFSSSVNTKKQKAYLEQLLNGGKLSTQTISSLAFHPMQYLAFQGFLVKFVNANLILYWMLNQFPVKALLMIRHPCATVSSQMRHGAWKRVKKNNRSLPPEVAADYPHLQAIYERLETVEELLAFQWVLKTYVPLCQPRPHPWLLLSYENLVANGESELGRIFEYLEQPIPKQAYAMLKKPSSTAQGLSNPALGLSPLAGWKDKLSTQQIDQILQVAHLAGMNFYTEDLMLDSKRLSGFFTKASSQ